MAILKQSDLIEIGINPDHAEEWLEIRKAKRKTLTESAWRRLLAEASLAGISPHRAVEVCCEEGWAGFKAEWYLKLYPVNFIQQHTDTRWADGFIERHTDRSWRDGIDKKLIN